MPIKNNNNLLNTINLYIKLRKLKEKYLKVYKADALKQVDINRLELEAQLRKASEEEELAKTKKEKREKELISAYILYFKELLSNNSRIFASVISITKTQAIKNKVVIIDSANSILCNLSNLLVIRFCIFSNSALENISILINKKVVEMQTNTTTTLANKLTAVNKLFTLVCSFRKINRYIFRANNTISITRQTIFNKFYNCKLESIIIAKFYKNL
ncbi:hypothetical protein HBH68_156300 [Parastagonospora nodorum]|nr:hypothetical protein HBH68_156300 [Parastagonospora nodorum]